jgi:hypothetical protein
MQPKVYSSILILSLLTLPLVWTTSALAHSTRSSLNSTSGIQSSLFAKNTNKAKSGKGSNPTGNKAKSGKGSNPTSNGIQLGKGSNSTGNGIPSGVGSSNNSNKGYKAGGSTPTGGFQSSGGSNPTGNGIPPGKGSNNDKAKKPPTKKPPATPLPQCIGGNGEFVACDSLPPVVNPNPNPEEFNNPIPEIQKKK